MPSIPQNRSNWNDPSNWVSAGEEWSQSWGSTHALWFGTILPRIAACLPADHLLEIACGHGRITSHLLPQCQRYTGVDLAPACVAICRQRFAARPHTSFHETDGRSLDMVEDDSVDFAFSWDSLVHAEVEAVSGYVTALGKKLRPGGLAFLHHSNLAAFVDATGKPTIANPHWRASTVSAERVRALAPVAGLACVAQELVQWGQGEDNDCFTLLRRAPTAGEALVLRHPDFGAEMSHLRQLDQLWRAPLR